MPLLSVERATVAYGEVEALHDVSITVDVAETVLVLGANGAGKSTLLNTISGRLRLRSGAIQFQGAPLSGRAHQVARAGVSLVPEGRGVLGELTVRENLRLGGYAHDGKRPAFGMERVFGLFPRLRERLDQPAAMLSGGEQQMLALGRGMLAGPRLLMVDELSLGLAPLITRQLLGLLDEIKREGVSVLIVEQSVKQALQVADRVYVLSNGRVVFEGKPAALQQQEALLRAYLGA